MPFVSQSATVTTFVPQEGGGQPPGGGGGQPGVPTHPIYIPVYPDNSLPPIEGLAPGHPIYLPVYPDNSLPQPPDSGNRPDNTLPVPPPVSPSHPIYIPVYPDNSLPPSGGGGGTPSHPIYIPVPPDVIWGDITYPDNTLPGELPPPTEEEIQKLKDFLFGNLPPPPDTIDPVRRGR